MAIVIEESGDKQINWVMVLTVGAVVFILFAGAYFIFFKKPELIEVVVPGKLQGITSISKVPFEPETVVNMPAFKVLKRQAADVPRVHTPGKTNPFTPQG